MRHTAPTMGGHLALVCALVAGPVAAQEEHSPGKPDRAHIERISADWPAPSREAIRFMMEKYGPPAAITPAMALWEKTGPWKRTIVFATEVPHEFPMHHTDVMQQWIDYKAPPELYDELARYDGSVVLERTSGEISARCDKEAANFLALNLTHEIVTGKRNVEEARRTYAEQIMAMKAKRPAPYTQRLMFQAPAAGATGDPDRPVRVSRAEEK